MHHRLRAAVLIGAVLVNTAAADAQQRTTGAAAGQGQPAVSLVPDDPARWDAVFFAGWSGGNRSGTGAAWNDWSDSGVFGASAGYYWTPHVKVELDVTTTTEGSVFSEEPLVLPGQLFPVFRTRRHHFQSTSMSGGVAYQFFENTWFHPFLGAGIEAGRETTRIETPAQFLPGREPGVPPMLTGAETERRSSSLARPFAMAGFKWYATERVFVRSDVRASFSTAQVESVVWRVGAGFDF